MEHTEYEATAQKHTGGKRVQPSPRKKLPVIFGILLAAAAAAYLALCVYAGTLDIFYPNRNINGINVGGMTVEAAQETLEREFPSRIVTFVSAQGEVLAETSLAELGYTADRFAGDAHFWLDQQKADSFLNRGWSFFNTATGRWDGGWNWPDPDMDMFNARIKGLCHELKQEPLDATYALNADSITIRKAKDGRTVDEAALRSAIGELPHAPKDLTVPVSFNTDSAQTFTARELHNQIAGNMKNAGYDAAAETITAEQIGIAFNVTSMQKQIDAAAPGEVISVSASIAYPTVTAEHLKEVLFRDVLGSSTTHVSGTLGRITNVKLAAAAFNNVVLNSGDVFSYNETVGQRTAEKGYMPAPAYVKGETVDELGGGVCQPSSNLYLACLLANLEITERYAHRFVPAYIDWGMDATVSWGGPDYKFTNNTDYPVKIVTTYSKNYLTVELLGTKTDDITVKMTNKELSSTPWKTVYELDETLAPGTEVVKTTPYTGYKVITYQHFYDGDGKLISSEQEAVSNYKVRDQVILQGPPKVEEPAMGDAVLPQPEDVPGSQPAFSDSGVTDENGFIIMPEDIPFLPEGSDLLWGDLYPSQPSESN